MIDVFIWIAFILGLLLLGLVFRLELRRHLAARREAHAVTKMILAAERAEAMKRHPAGRDRPVNW